MNKFSQILKNYLILIIFPLIGFYCIISEYFLDEDDLRSYSKSSISISKINKIMLSSYNNLENIVSKVKLSIILK